MNHSTCNQGQYELAEQEKSFRRLLPYPCKLVLWQTHHPQDKKIIGQISSHMHGYFHYRCQRPILHTHLIPHAACEKDCTIIEKRLRKTLALHLIHILKVKCNSLDQQALI